MKLPGHNTVLQVIRSTMAALLIALLSTPATSMADEAPDTEYRIKAAFMYNFSRFTIWPEETLQGGSEFSLCTLGSTRFRGQLDTLAGKTVHNKTIVVKHLDSTEDALDCQLVFIGELDDLTETLWTLKGQPVLTVSNDEGFTENGGIIEFKLIDNKIRFRINVDAAKSSRLAISSKLLSLAISVTDTR